MDTKNCYECGGEMVKVDTKRKGTQVWKHKDPEQQKKCSFKFGSVISGKQKETGTPAQTPNPASGGKNTNEQPTNTPARKSGKRASQHRKKAAATGQPGGPPAPPADAKPKPGFVLGKFF